MQQFKFHYLENTPASHQEANTWKELNEDQQFTSQFTSHFAEAGFKLKNGWIIFTIYENKIRAFYKQIDNPTWFTYYRKDLPKDCPVIFEFTEQDEVEKVGNQWQKKGGIHA